MKNKILFLLILLISFIGPVFAFDNTLKVYDYANILTEEEEAKLKEEVDRYISNYNMDMVLVTVRHHTKNNTEEYADYFYDYNGFGIGTDNRGIIFVIDFTFNRNIQIETTGDAINLYDDDRINIMLDNIVDIKDKDYYYWFKSFIDDANTFASRGYPTYNEKIKNNFPLGKIIIISLVIDIIVLIILISKNRMIKKSTNANLYINDESVKITTRNDRFLTTHTTSVRIDTPSNNGGGHSSTHIGSSGISHGGGGRSL